MSARWLTVAEVAALFRVDAGTVTGWIEAGRLRAVNVASVAATKRHRWRVSAEAVEAFAAERAAVPPPPAQRRPPRLRVKRFFS